MTVGRWYLAPLYAIKLFRGYDWWYSKIQPLYLFIYIQVLLSFHGRALSPETVYVKAFLMIFTVSALAAYGHLFNDYCDRRNDEQVGKIKLSAKYSAGSAFTLFLVTVGLGLIPLLTVENRGWPIIIMALNYLAATVYSAPLIRFKERGSWGVIIASLAQRALPTLYVNSLLGAIGGGMWSADLHLPILETAWTFMIGVRWIIIHQLLDETNDRLAGVNTFTTVSGDKAARLFLTRAAFPLEAGLLILLLVVLCQQTPLLLIVIGLYLLVSIIRQLRSGKPIQFEKRLTTYPSILGDFYEIWLPLGFAVIITLHDVRYLGFVFIHLTLFNPFMPGLVFRAKRYFYGR